MLLITRCIIISVISSLHLKAQIRVYSFLDWLAWKHPNDERRYRAVQRADPLHKRGPRGEACKPCSDASVSAVQRYCRIGPLLWTTIQLLEWCQSTFFGQHILHGRSVRLPLCFCSPFEFHRIYLRIYLIAMGIITISSPNLNFPIRYTALILALELFVWSIVRWISRMGLHSPKITRLFMCKCATTIAVLCWNMLVDISHFLL